MKGMFAAVVLTALFTTVRLDGKMTAGRLEIGVDKALSLDPAGGRRKEEGWPSKEGVNRRI